LVDPVAVIDESEPINLRSSLNFLKQDQIILHFGAMTKSKGTIDILDLLETIPENNLDNLVFIFAGVVKKDIIDVFIEKTTQLSSKVRIIIYNDFLEYSFINSLFYSSDIILCPYQRVFQSSGVIGLAAKYNKPVIVPKKGFLGKLVKKNKIGFTYNNFNKEEFLSLIEKSKFYTGSDKYISTHKVKDFSNIISNSF
jgi:glycosyltransferase involved in cell wall biosynthesis